MEKHDKCRIFYDKLYYICGVMASDKHSIVLDPEVPYNAIDDRTGLHLIEMIRSGIQYKTFLRFANSVPISLLEWSSFLHISARTLQRYQTDQKTFDPPQSEKILEIALLFKKGTSVWGDKDQFNTWLDTDNVALGRIRPKSLLDSSIGIRMLNDELGRIEHGILA